MGLLVAVGLCWLMHNTYAHILWTVLKEIFCTALYFLNRAFFPLFPGFIYVYLCPLRLVVMEEE